MMARYLAFMLLLAAVGLTAATLGTIAGKAIVPREPRASLPFPYRLERHR
jgi:hypothetical protein